MDIVLVVLFFLGLVLYKTLDRQQKLTTGCEVLDQALRGMCSFKTIIGLIRFSLWYNQSKQWHVHTHTHYCAQILYKTFFVQIPVDSILVCLILNRKEIRKYWNPFIFCPSKCRLSKLTLLFSGGILCTGITEISGESASGKTQFGLQLSLTAQLSTEYGGLNAGSTCLNVIFSTDRQTDWPSNDSSIPSHLIPSLDRGIIKHYL